MKRIDGILALLCSKTGEESQRILQRDFDYTVNHLISIISDRLKEPAVVAGLLYFFGRLILLGVIHIVVFQYLFVKKDHRN